MLTRRALLVATALAAAAGHAQRGAPPEANAELPGARLHGQGRLAFFGLPVYDARLWVRDGFAAAEWQRSPLLLELDYARTLYGRQIAERSLKEVRRQSDIDDAKGERWVAEMARLYPDVRRGDRISGLYRPDGATRIFFNGTAQGDIHDADFTRLFFGIWLSPQTSEPKLREQLLGLGAR